MRAATRSEWSPAQLIRYRVTTGPASVSMVRPPPSRRMARTPALVMTSAPRWAMSAAIFVETSV
jgi:hypothetical protein